MVITNQIYYPISHQMFSYIFTICDVPEDFTCVEEGIFADSEGATPYMLEKL